MDLSNLTSSDLMIAAGLLCVIAILAALGYLDRFFLRTRNRTEVMAPRGQRTRLVAPGYGEVTVTGVVKIGDKILPLTEEYGKDNPLPLDLKFDENTFMIDPVENFVGSDLGRMYIHYPDGQVPDVEHMSRVKAYKKRLSIITLENEYLKNQVERLTSRRNDTVLRDANVLSEVKKKFGNPVDPAFLEKQRKYGYGND